MDRFIIRFIYEIIKNDTVEIIIIKYKNGLLEKHLGDILIKAYKKDDPLIQSIWGVDTTRLHFILKKEEWTSDNCGIKLTEFVIDPFLESVKKMIDKYCDDNQPNREDNKSAFDNFTKKWKFCQEILVDISKKKLHKQILKYINPHLKLTPDDIKIKSHNKKKNSDTESESESEKSSSESDKKPKKKIRHKQKSETSTSEESSADSVTKRQIKILHPKKITKKVIVVQESDSDSE